jgi:hypothetical protein
VLDLSEQAMGFRFVPVSGQHEQVVAGLAHPFDNRSLGPIVHSRMRGEPALK